jgi:arylsulfatase A-like enzyme
MRKRAWRTTRWKLIEAMEPDIYGLPPVELYDLRSDPGETRNLALEAGTVRDTLQRELRAHVDRRLAETGKPDPLVEQTEALRTWQPRFVAGRRG